MRIEPADRGRLVLASALTALAMPVLVMEYHQNNRGRTPSVAVQGGSEVLVVPAPAPGTNSNPTVTAASVTQSTVTAALTQPTSPPPTSSLAPADTAAKVTSSGSLVGKVSFRDFDEATWGVRSCAAFLLPLNTRVELTNTNNGKTSWCVVREQRELGGDLVLAVDTKIFDELDNRSVGVATVRLTWSS
jgi:hypothetical protein